METHLDKFWTTKLDWTYLDTINYKLTEVHFDQFEQTKFIKTHLDLFGLKKLMGTQKNLFWLGETP